MELFLRLHLRMMALLPLSAMTVAVRQRRVKRAAGRLHPALCLLVYEAALLQRRSSRIWPLGELWCPAGAPTWAYELPFTPLTHLPLLHRWRLLCPLFVSMSGSERTTWWRGTFRWSDACFLLSPHNGPENSTTEDESRCLLGGVEQRRAHNGRAAGFSARVLLI